MTRARPPLKRRPGPIHPKDKNWKRASMYDGPITQKASNRKVIVVLIAVTIIILVVLATIYVWAQSFAGDSCNCTPIAWRVEVHDGNYLIEIIDVESRPLDEVGWTILDLTRIYGGWEDPSNELIRMEGDLIDINFTESDYDRADVTEYDKILFKGACWGSTSD